MNIFRSKGKFKTKKNEKETLITKENHYSNKNKQEMNNKKENEKGNEIVERLNISDWDDKSDASNYDGNYYINGMSYVVNNCFYNQLLINYDAIIL